MSNLAVRDSKTSTQEDDKHYTCSVDADHCQEIIYNYVPKAGSVSMFGRLKKGRREAYEVSTDSCLVNKATCYLLCTSSLSLFLI